MKAPAEKSSSSSAHRLWGELVLGPYAVGFQSFVLRDYSRRFELPGIPEGASHDSSAGRPLAVQVWYPAEPAADAVAMPYKGYLSLSSGDPSLQEFVEALNTFLVETACQESMGQRWSGLASDDAKSFETFLQIPTACYPNAQPLDRLPGGWRWSQPLCGPVLPALLH